MILPTILLFRNAISDSTGSIEHNDVSAIGYTGTDFAASGILTFENRDLVIDHNTVTGTGATPVQHGVDLSWDPSASTVIGYSVYRATISGGPYTKFNSSPNANTNYADNTVPGQTYFYVITSVGSTGVESGYSNQVSAVVPLS